MSLLSLKWSLPFCFYTLSLFAQGSTVDNCYTRFCALASIDDYIFTDFKRNAGYREILEHVSKETGQRYLKVIRDEYPELLKRCDAFRQNDAVGNPFTEDFDAIGRFSPTTLRYMKVAGDLQYEYGDLSNLHIVEIGGGYGGQCKILDALGGFASYTLIDLPECNELSKKYIQAQKINNVRFINSNELEKLDQVDLVISNYALSGLKRDEQNNYIEKVINSAPRGYLTWNFNAESMPYDEFVKILYNKGHLGIIKQENPITCDTNQIITWGPSRRKVAMSSERLALLPSTGSQPDNAITYNFSGGRLGDNLLAYFHAKWLAWKYGLPLLYKPFDHSNFLSLSQRDTPYGSTGIFKKTITINDEDQISREPSSSLFVVPFSPPSRLEYDMMKGYLGNVPFVATDWNDPEFRQEIVQCLQPITAVETLPLPQDKVTVGVHVRRGSGWDEYDKLSILLPLKFPPDHYYISQIKRVAEFFKDQPIYVYIFTDDKNPENIIKTYSEEINNPQITWASNSAAQNGGDEAMWRDFYSMGKFDCIIRCVSNFSIMASMLGHYDLMITPLHCCIKDQKPYIDGVEMEFMKLTP